MTRGEKYPADPNEVGAAAGRCAGHERVGGGGGVGCAHVGAAAVDGAAHAPQAHDVAQHALVVPVQRQPLHVHHLLHQNSVLA